MYLSCCVWALTAPVERVLADMNSLGFRWIDIRPGFLRTAASQAYARSRSLSISSVAASYGAPENAALDSEETGARDRALVYVDQVVAQCAALGGSAVYLVPGADDRRAALKRYADSLAIAAQQAQGKGVRLCVEHFPGTALPTAAATLDFIEAIDHPNLGLLLDIGHTQISDEDPGAAIRRAGARLAYVHLDDNDGKDDLHWALMDGALTAETLRRLFHALDEIDYAGAVSLELSPQLQDPFAALQRSRRIALNYGADYLLGSGKE